MLKCNPNKTEFIYFSSKFKPRSEVTKIFFEGHQLVMSDTVLNLGVKIDKHLSFRDSVSDICRSASLCISRIGKIRSYLDVSTTERLIHALVSCKLDYCNSLLCMRPRGEMDRLQRIQNAAARVVTLSKKRQSISPILRRLHWLPIEMRLHYKILTISFNILSGDCPVYLRDLLKPLPHTRDLRSTAANCYQPRSRLVAYGDRIFSRIAPRLWNSLPQIIRASNSISTFKSRLKTYFLCKEDINPNSNST